MSCILKVGDRFRNSREKPQFNAMPTRNHDESKPHRRCPTYLAIGLVLVLLVYPLSSGPACVLLYRTGIPERFFVLSYSPVIRASEATKTKRLLQEYINFWFRLTATSAEIDLLP
jgi:hypothetical protein